MEEEKRQEQAAIQESMKLSLKRKKTEDYLKEGALEDVDQDELQQQLAILKEIENSSNKKNGNFGYEKSDSFKKPVLKEEVKKVVVVEEPDYLADFKVGDRDIMKKMSEVGLKNIGNSCYV